MNEFKLNFYFTLYKDKPLPNRLLFRERFKKHHGYFQYLEELIVMIERYQMKKYGHTLSFNNYRTKEECKRLSVNDRNRKRMLRERLGRKKV